MRKNIFRYLKDRFLLSEEIHQSLIRFVLVLIIVFYIVGFELILRDKGEIPHLYFLIALIVISIIEIPISYWCGQLDESNRYRKLFRVLTNLIDNFLLSLAMVIMGYAGVILFPIYLWITFGIGIRYGVRYLMLSATLNILCFSSVIYISPIWHDESTILLSFGLLVALIILPSYVYILIKKLSVALDNSRKAVRIKESFLANINHELRTPLTSIINLTELMHDSNFPDKYSQIINMINTSANIQLKIINGVLDLSKIEAGAYELSYKIFSVYNLLQEVRQIIFPQTIKKAVKFYIYIDPKIHHHHFGAQEQIKQILINIAANAVKFTDHGYILISANSLGNNHKSQRIIFKVEDTGIGIDKKHHQEIFKPFNQAEVSISNKYGGTGLGISISNELSKLMNATISIESEVGKGTVFIFDVNLKIADVNNQDDLSAIEIIPTNLTDRETKMLNYYSHKYGTNIFKNSDKRLSIKVVHNTKHNSIFIYSDSNTENLSEEDINYLNNEITAKICIVNDESYNMEIVPITSIKHGSPLNILDNALYIASEFLPKNTNRQYIDPQRIDRLNILIAEDDPTQSIIHEMLFSSFNCNLKIVQDGSSALSELLKNKYDVAVLDLHMPEISGLDVAIEFNLSNPGSKTALVLLTADIMPSTTINEYASLFSEIIYKPISLAKLLESILDIYDEGKGESPLLNHVNPNKYTDFNGEEHIIYSGLKINSDLIQNMSSIANLSDLLNLVDVYDKETDAQIDNLIVSMRSNDYLKTKNILHKMKGASSSVGAISFNEYISSYADIRTNSDRIYLSLDEEELRKIHAQSVAILRSRIEMLNA